MTDRGPAAAEGGGNRDAPFPPGTAERRQLTVMMCDLVDSTALAAQLDPEDLHELIGSCLRTVADVVTFQGGVVSRFLGDGVFAYFGFPRANEDDVERAIRAGLQVVEAIGRLALPGGHRPRIRIGIATGLVVVGETGRASIFPRNQDVVGATPNLAARLQAVAGPDQVVVAATTHKLARGLFDFVDLGSVMLKGFDQPMQVWQVSGLRKVESPFDAQYDAGTAPLVGREQELQLLLRRWEEVENGAGRCVLLLGEPGIGKSRIRRALQEQLAGRPHRRMSFYCSPQQTGSSFYPIISRLEQWMGFTKEDKPESKLAKLEAFASRTAFPTEQMPLLAELLSVGRGRHAAPSELDPEERKERTMEALVEQLAIHSAQRPSLVIFEDLHWVDPSTLELLEVMVRRLDRLRILLVIIARPEFAPRWPGETPMTTLVIGRLSRAETADLARSVAGDEALPDAVMQQILSRTDGIPLFVEELTKAVLESGVVREGDADGAADASPAATAIPETLHDSLMARLDRMGGLREIAQVGAAIGREFSADVLSEVAGLPPKKVGEGLVQLVNAQLLSRRGEASEARYRFKHALICEAAYSTLLRGRRQELHSRIVTVLEERFASLAEQQPELLGHHCTEAGLGEKAVAYWGEAGRKSAARHAKVEAVAHFRRALALLATLPTRTDRRRQELELESALGRALIAARIGAEETGESHRRARKLCEELGDSGTLAQVLGGLAMFHLGRCELKPAAEAAEELLRLGQQQNDPGTRLAGHLFSGLCRYWIGELAPARAELEKVADLPIPADSSSGAAIAARDMRIAAHCFLSLTLLLLGRPEDAVRRSREAVEQSRALLPPQTLARELTYAGLFNLLRRAEEEALALAEECISLASERHYAFWLDIARVIRGFAVATRGNLEEGLAQVRAATAQRERTGSLGGQPYFLALLAQLCDAAGQADEAWSVLGQALDLVERTGERWYEPELHRLRGEWLLAHRRDAPGQAEASLLQAHSLARARGAKLWELRAALSLGRLRRQQGRRSEACRLVALACGSFDDEFETPDLADAKAFIAALARRDAAEEEIWLSAPTQAKAREPQESRIGWDGTYI